MLGTAGLEDALPLGAAELEEDLAALVARGALPPLDLDYCAHAMVAVGVELGARDGRARAARPRGRARFATGLFLGGIGRA